MSNICATQQRLIAVLVPLILLCAVSGLSALEHVTAPAGPAADTAPTGLSAEAVTRGRFGTPGMFETAGSYFELGAALRYRSPSGFFAGIDYRALNDERYALGREWLNAPLYFLIHEAGLGYRDPANQQPLRGRAGRFVHHDVVASPYSLFVSSRDIPAFLFELEYAGDLIYFVTRSVTLNNNSALGYPDRSIVFQTIALRRPRWEFGFQDATVLVPTPDAMTGEQASDGSGPVFAPEYFFVPLPSYLNQYTVGSGENPWVQDINYKSLMGFYGVFRDPATATGPGRWEPGGWEIEAQLLIDDFNANAIADPGNEHQNPFMGAWMLSGLLRTPHGTFRLSHAGALAYTFQTSSNRNYSYTYYPDVVVKHSGRYRPMDYRDNYFGFFLGPNTAALRLDWDHELHDLPLPGRAGALGLNASVEYTVSGSKSPMNPWAEYEDWSDTGTAWPFESTRFLDEKRLEHGLRLSTDAEIEIPLGPGVLMPGIGIEMGWWQNVLRLTTLQTAAREDGGRPDPPVFEMYRPSAESYRLLGLSLGLRYLY